MVDVARVAGIGRAQAHEHLVALLEAGHVERHLLPGRGKRPHVYVATTAPPAPLFAVDAVRQVLAAGPVTGRDVIARRAGFNPTSVGLALAKIATRERLGHNTPTTYRLREGA